MGAVKDYAMDILAADLANKKGISLEAADDYLKEFNWKICDFLFGEDSHYKTLAEIFDDYGIPRHLAWVFDCTEEILNKL